MSYQHCRTSSELEPIQLKEIIPILYDPFKKNFDLYDIKELVNRIFTRQEIDQILNEKNDKAKTLRLIWLLCDKPQELIEGFVNALQNDYKFIKDYIMEEWIRPKPNTELYIEKVKELYSRDQRYTDYNVHRMDAYLELHTALKLLKPRHYVVLLGVLGSGKKWLTMDVCSEYSLFRVMGFKIYWLNVKNCTSPEEDLGILQQLRHMIDTDYKYDSDANGNPNIQHRISFMQTELHRLFRTKELENSLLILLDVKNIKTLKAFNLGCKTLVVTRYQKVSDYLSPKLTIHITLPESLTESEMVCLFEKYMKCERDRFPRNAVYSISKKTQNPLKLSFIALNLRQRKSDWSKWTDMAFDKFDKLTAIMERALNVLDEYHLKLYATLSIFPEAVDIPIALLAFLWNHNNAQTLKIIAKFNEKSLIIKNPDDKTIALPSIYSTELLHSAKIQSLIDCQELHKKVIDHFNIPAAFDNRSDPELPDMPDYFYGCIAHHLSQLKDDDKRRELFAKIFLDFSFIEQKIRVESGSILNTLVQLKVYQEQICGGDMQRRKLINAIRDFLPKIQEKVVQSRDTCLLQCALFEHGSGGAVYEESCRQVRRYPSQTWFADRGSFHQRRQILDLGNQQALHAKYLNHDNCLVVLENNDILLADISLECNYGTTHLLGDNTPITQLYVFNKERQLLTLHSYTGTLSLWMLSDNDRRDSSSSVCNGYNNNAGTSLVHRRSSKLRINPFYKHARHAKLIHKREPKQVLNDVKLPGREYIVAFYVEETPPPYEKEIYLHIAYDNGDVCLYEWVPREQEFRKSHTPTLQTRQLHLRFLTKVLRKYYVLVTATGICSIWNLKNSAKMIERSVLIAEQTTLSFKSTHIVHMDTYEPLAEDGQHYTNVLMVFNNQVVTLQFLNKDYADLENHDFKPELIYEHCNADEGAITCAKLSQDANILVLGTQQGVIVYDMKTNLPSLRSNFSERINCVDIYDLDDKIFRYIVLCGAEKKPVLHINALREHSGTLTWAHSVEQELSSGSDGVAARLEPDVRLRGQKLYDVSYGENGQTHLYSVDTKYRVHENDNDNWSTIVPNESTCPITAITSYKQTQTFVAYLNGAIFNVKDEQLIEQNYFENVAISYLQLLDDETLVASAHPQQQTLVLNLSQEPPKQFPFPISCLQAYKLFDKYLLFIGKDSFYDLDMSSPQKLQSEYLEQSLHGYDLQNSLLFLATYDNAIFIYHFTCSKKGRLEHTLLKYKGEPILSTDEDQEEVHVSCLSAARDGSLFAVGLTNGNIEVYQFQDLEINFIYNLESHTKPIFQMKFSPLNLVLVSCAEQLCFWSVQHMLNNPLLIEKTAKRRSSRFSSLRSNCDDDTHGVEEVDAKAMSPFGRHLRVRNSSSIDNIRVAMLQHATTTYERRRFSAESGLTYANEQSSEYVWLNKRGTNSKPELLACIKFDGNRAEKFYANDTFTQFNTIDDEGVYYHLSLLEVEGNPLESHQLTFDDDVIFVHDFGQMERERQELVVVNNEPMDAVHDAGIDVISDSLQFHLDVADNPSTSMPSSTLTSPAISLTHGITNGNHIVSI